MCVCVCYAVLFVNFRFFIGCCRLIWCSSQTKMRLGAQPCVQSVCYLLSVFGVQVGVRCMSTILISSHGHLSFHFFFISIHSGVPEFTFISITHLPFQFICHISCIIHRRPIYSDFVIVHLRRAFLLSSDRQMVVWFGLRLSQEGRGLNSVGELENVHATSTSIAAQFTLPLPIDSIVKNHIFDPADPIHSQMWCEMSPHLGHGHGVYDHASDNKSKESSSFISHVTLLSWTLPPIPTWIFFRSVIPKSSSFAPTVLV